MRVRFLEPQLGILSTGVLSVVSWLIFDLCKIKRILIEMYTHITSETRFNM